MKHIRLQRCHHPVEAANPTYSLSLEDLDLVTKYCTLLKFEVIPCLLHTKVRDDSKLQWIVETILDCTLRLSICINGGNLNSTSTHVVITASRLAIDLMEGQGQEPRPSGGEMARPEIATTFKAIEDLYRVASAKLASSLDVLGSSSTSSLPASSSVAAPMQRGTSSVTGAAAEVAKARPEKYWNQQPLVSHCSITTTRIDYEHVSQASLQSIESLMVATAGVEREGVQGLTADYLKYLRSREVTAVEDTVALLVTFAYRLFVAEKQAEGSSIASGGGSGAVPSMECAIRALFSALLQSPASDRINPSWSLECADSLITSILHALSIKKYFDVASGDAAGASTDRMFYSCCRQIAALWTISAVIGVMTSQLHAIYCRPDAAIQKKMHAVLLKMGELVSYIFGGLVETSAALSRGCAVESRASGLSQLFGALLPNAHAKAGESMRMLAELRRTSPRVGAAKLAEALVHQVQISQHGGSYQYSDISCDFSNQVAAIQTMLVKFNANAPALPADLVGLVLSEIRVAARNVKQLETLHPTTMLPLFCLCSHMNSFLLERNSGDNQAFVGRFQSELQSFFACLNSSEITSEITASMSGFIRLIVAKVLIKSIGERIEDMIEASDVRKEPENCITVGQQLLVVLLNEYILQESLSSSAIVGEPETECSEGELVALLDSLLSTPGSAIFSSTGGGSSTRAKLEPIAAVNSALFSFVPPSTMQLIAQMGYKLQEKATRIGDALLCPYFTAGPNDGAESEVAAAASSTGAMEVDLLQHYPGGAVLQSTRLMSIAFLMLCLMNATECSKVAAKSSSLGGKGAKSAFHDCRRNLFPAALLIKMKGFAIGEWIIGNLLTPDASHSSSNIVLLALMDCFLIILRAERNKLRCCMDELKNSDSHISDGSEHCIFAQSIPFLVSLLDHVTNSTTSRDAGDNAKPGRQTSGNADGFSHKSRDMAIQGRSFVAVFKTMKLELSSIYAESARMWEESRKNVSGGPVRIPRSTSGDELHSCRKSSQQIANISSATHIEVAVAMMWKLSTVLLTLPVPSKEALLLTTSSFAPELREVLAEWEIAFFALRGFNETVPAAGRRMEFCQFLNRIVDAGVVQQLGCDSEMNCFLRIVSDAMQLCSDSQLKSCFRSIFIFNTSGIRQEMTPPKLGSTQDKLSPAGRRQEASSALTPPYSVGETTPPHGKVRAQDLSPLSTNSAAQDRRMYSSPSTRGSPSSSLAPGGPANLQIQKQEQGFVRALASNLFKLDQWLLTVNSLFESQQSFAAAPEAARTSPLINLELVTAQTLEIMLEFALHGHNVPSAAHIDPLDLYCILKSSLGSANSKKANNQPMLVQFRGHPYAVQQQIKLLQQFSWVHSDYLNQISQNSHLLHVPYIGRLTKEYYWELLSVMRTALGGSASPKCSKIELQTRTSTLMKHLLILKDILCRCLSKASILEVLSHLVVSDDEIESVAATTEGAKTGNEFSVNLRCNTDAISQWMQCIVLLVSQTGSDSESNCVWLDICEFINNCLGVVLSKVFARVLELLDESNSSGCVDFLGSELPTLLPLIQVLQFSSKLSPANGECLGVGVANDLLELICKHTLLSGSQQQIDVGGVALKIPMRLCGATAASRTTLDAPHLMKNFTFVLDNGNSKRNDILGNRLQIIVAYTVTPSIKICSTECKTDSIDSEPFSLDMLMCEINVTPLKVLRHNEQVANSEKTVCSSLCLAHDSLWAQCLGQTDFGVIYGREMLLDSDYMLHRFLHHSYNQPLRMNDIVGFAKNVDSKTSDDKSLPALSDIFAKMIRSIFGAGFAELGCGSSKKQHILSYHDSLYLDEIGTSQGDESMKTLQYIWGYIEVKSKAAFTVASAVSTRLESRQGDVGAILNDGANSSSLSLKLILLEAYLDVREASNDSHHLVDENTDPLFINFVQCNRTLSSKSMESLTCMEYLSNILQSEFNNNTMESGLNKSIISFGFAALSMQILEFLQLLVADELVLAILFIIHSLNKKQSGTELNPVENVTGFIDRILYSIVNVIQLLDGRSAVCFGDSGSVTGETASLGRCYQVIEAKIYFIMQLYLTTLRKCTLFTMSTAGHKVLTASPLCSFVEKIDEIIKSLAVKMCCRHEWCAKHETSGASDPVPIDSAGAVTSTVARYSWRAVSNLNRITRETVLRDEARIASATPLPNVVRARNPSGEGVAVNMHLQFLRWSVQERHQHGTPEVNDEAYLLQVYSEIAAGQEMDLNLGRDGDGAIARGLSPLRRHLRTSSPLWVQQKEQSREGLDQANDEGESSAVASSAAGGNTATKPDIRIETSQAASRRGRRLQRQTTSASSSSAGNMLDSLLAGTALPSKLYAEGGDGSAGGIAASRNNISHGRQGSSSGSNKGQSVSPPPRHPGSSPSSTRGVSPQRGHSSSINSIGASGAIDMDQTPPRDAARKRPMEGHTQERVVVSTPPQGLWRQSGTPSPEETSRSNQRRRLDPSSDRDSDANDADCVGFPINSVPGLSPGKFVTSNRRSGEIDDVGRRRNGSAGSNSTNKSSNGKANGASAGEVTDSDTCWSPPVSFSLFSKIS